MMYEEKIKDIFKVKNVDLVAQCIAQDAHMGAGIAVMFDKRYPNMKSTIQKSKPNLCDVFLWNEGRKDKSNRPPVANLITKPSSFRPPTYDNFKTTIEGLRNLIIEKEYKTIAIPMIGAGLDRLNWKTQVLPCLFENLYDLDIELTVYFTEQNADNMISHENQVEIFETYNKKDKFATVRGEEYNYTCDLCLGKTQTVHLDAFHDSYCIVCSDKISNPTSLINIVCENCAKEENMCVKCGEKLEK